MKDYAGVKVWDKGDIGNTDKIAVQCLGKI